MLTNLLFFIAFLIASYVMSRLADSRRALRPEPARIKATAARRHRDGSVR